MAGRTAHETFSELQAGAVLALTYDLRLTTEKKAARLTKHLATHSEILYFDVKIHWPLHLYDQQQNAYCLFFILIFTACCAEPCTSHRLDVCLSVRLSRARRKLVSRSTTKERAVKRPGIIL